MSAPPLLSSAPSPRSFLGWPVEAGPGRLRFALYALHLLFTVALAISNILLALALLASARSRETWRRIASSGPAVRWAALYLGLLVASVLAAPFPRDSARALSEVFTFATFLLAFALVRGERAVRWLLDATVLVGAAVAVSGLLQLAAGYGDLERRIRGPFSHYMTFAGCLLLIDMVLVARLLARRPAPDAAGPTRWLDHPAVAWSALVAINLALVASLTRSAWLALVVALLALGAFVYRRLLLVAPVAAGAFLILAPVPVVARALSVTDLEDRSNYDRVCMAAAGLQMVTERPLLGIGPEEVRRRYPLYRHPTAPRRTVPHLHNAYIQLAAERGLPALGAALGLAGLSLFRAYRGYRGAGRAGGRADVHLGVLGALVAFGIAALFENNWGDTEVQRLLLFLLAVPWLLPAEPEAARPEPTP